MQPTDMEFFVKCQEAVGGVYQECTGTECIINNREANKISQQMERYTSA